MTAPVTADDLIQGVVKHLEAQPDVLAAVGAYPDNTAWLFQHKLWVEVESTGSTAAVLSGAGGWAGGNIHNTLSFPRLQLDLWADPIRDAGRNIADPGEVYRRIDAAFRIFDRHLHRAAGGTQMWGAVRTVDSVRLTDPAVVPVPDGDGLLRSQTFYAITQG